MKNLDEIEERGLLEEKGIWFFNGEVNDDSCYDVVRWILEENLDAKHGMLSLIINSPGGDVSAGFAIVDAMCGSKIPIRTIGMGCLASMGLLMFITGKKGERVLTPNTLIMSHQWSDCFEGKEHELIAGIKRNDLITEMVIKHYRKHTGLSTKRIRKFLLPPSDVYLSAKEACELGLCDQIRLK
jgi:ATP-dependent Clp protease, protease subunit